MTGLAVAIGTPIGILAGTYMAEYGRYARLTSVVRFINDILLSAPSIVIGLFVYEVMVAPMGHFSGIAGAAALALIVVPVVVRTTEDMLLLVPNTLREAAFALGIPRYRIIAQIVYRAARAGMLTGVLLAIARISGETAPLLFTALNNQFWSADLNAPMASLPAVIFQFALSPYKDWQKLAWTGALIITITVPCAQHHRAGARRHRKSRHERRIHADRRSPDRLPRGDRRRRSERQGFGPQPEFLLRRQPGAEGHQSNSIRIR